MAEGARLESVYTATYRGFESPPHRHLRREARIYMRAFFSHVAPYLGGDENPRPGFDNWRSQLDRPAAGRAARTKMPGAFLNNACVGPEGARPRDGPSNGERSESIPPGATFNGELTCSAPPGGMRTPDRGSTTGAASWTGHRFEGGLSIQNTRVILK